MQLTGVVLAGGQSSRMGTDKSALTFAAKSWQEHACQLLLDTGVTEVLISKNKPGYMADIYPNNGPLGGIYSALTQSDQDLLITAVDMPLLTASTLKNLVISAEKSQTNACYYQHHPLPLVLTNTLFIRDTLKAILIDNEKSKSIKHFLSVIGTVELNIPASNSLININTPEQLNAVL